VLSTQEKRIHELAGELVPILKRRDNLKLRGGAWELGYDFAQTPRLVWSYSGRRSPPFAVIPSQKRIIGLGPLRYGSAERKLREAKRQLGARRP